MAEGTRVRETFSRRIIATTICLLFASPSLAEQTRTLKALAALLVYAMECQDQPRLEPDYLKRLNEHAKQEGIDYDDTTGPFRRVPDFMVGWSQLTRQGERVAACTNMRVFISTEATR